MLSGRAFTRARWDEDVLHMNVVSAAAQSRKVILTMKLLWTLRVLGDVGIIGLREVGRHYLCIGLVMFPEHSYFANESYSHYLWLCRAGMTGG